MNNTPPAVKCPTREEAEKHWLHKTVMLTPACVTHGSLHAVLNQQALTQKFKVESVQPTPVADKPFIERVVLFLSHPDLNVPLTCGGFEVTLAKAPK